MGGHGHTHSSGSHSLSSTPTGNQGIRSVASTPIFPNIDNSCGCHKCQVKKHAYLPYTSILAQKFSQCETFLTLEIHHISTLHISRGGVAIWYANLDTNKIWRKLSPVSGSYPCRSPAYLHRSSTLAHKSTQTCKSLLNICVRLMNEVFPRRRRREKSNK